MVKEKLCFIAVKFYKHFHFLRHVCQFSTKLINKSKSENILVILSAGIFKVNSTIIAVKFYRTYYKRFVVFLIKNIREYTKAFLMSVFYLYFVN